MDKTITVIGTSKKMDEQKLAAAKDIKKEQKLIDKKNLKVEDLLKRIEALEDLLGVTF